MASTYQKGLRRIDWVRNPSFYSIKKEFEKEKELKKYEKK